ncbi:bifunctional [glutamine synthetase] adenylyltransferase/[glutamine synthetase]-adenylyl-L-tyrosine phosphorylase [Epibacterium sp. SM1979]|uniref:Bifunctional [glutamine synthetase] adenylyltransferase/[glutamine synthetase]-adenylyl-L-tyrosine phosphorylase n=1 Tax=Tritonibacter litoralis TaxID=2662264 RepID=A0A843YDK6_9RHOB|nr:bifunctional [glutamine synthetase] adenylyltransferase/[glutamine synthetase]-adenylyl-L-tyrosine phosphorylase [Tritonibacter litoralis]MQQ07402.1 bifunctional [glutamine synthetase] adenylyltransferase/[glutamine synthetase]-adenylyl-L-tyrosine phosphorylase [Tritonibacter litoralis]
MTTALTLTCCPRAFDPALAHETLAALPWLAPEHKALIAGTSGTSPYLNSLILMERDWLPEALDNPQAALISVMAAVSALNPDQLKPELRRAKRRVALLTALCDLAGFWSLEKVTAALSDFAALTADVALKAEIAKLIARKKLPGQTEEDVAAAAGLAVLAMGKMGAHELNYSSDIDLICLFDETRYEPDDFYEVRQALVRATRNMCATLSDKTAEGYVFRTDLRLRPDPAVTPVCVAMEAAERYYESLGRTWERAAYIKARACAGDIQAGEKFLHGLRPFVWRRHLDFAAIQDAHDMRLRIRENKGSFGAVSVPGHDMKLGQGGIREIEFFTQTRQLIAGGRDPDLRVRETVKGLEALAQKGWFDLSVADELSDHYRAHRTVEHRIQMIHDAQTHRMPKSEDGLGRVASLMDLDVSDMVEQVGARLHAVRKLADQFFAPGDTGEAEQPTLPAIDPETFDPEILRRWHTYPALRSERGAQIFERLRPELLSRLSRTAQPAESLIALDGFLAGLPAGVQIFSLFEANPQLIDLLVDIVGTSPELAGFLSRNASVFDAVIGGAFFDPWPEGAALLEEIKARLAAEEDYEAKLDAARLWCKEWTFRIGVHHLRGLITGKAAGGQYAELASVTIEALAPVVVDHFALKHGRPPGRGVAVLGMGSLGSSQMTAKSDLDLIVIYDPQQIESSDGKRPLASRAYYARLTQALITALTAPMARGRLYEVDMRLRPSGTQGPVATSISAFDNYQHNEAWVWEHLALTRARVICGGGELARDVETIRADVLRTPNERAKVLAEVSEMRDRLSAAKQPKGPLDVKNGAGRMVDVELVAQTGALLAGEVARGVAPGLKAAEDCGWLGASQVQILRESYDLYREVQMAARLLSAEPLEEDAVGEGAARFICRVSGAANLADLVADLNARYARCAEIAQTALAEE